LWDYFKVPVGDPRRKTVYLCDGWCTGMRKTFSEWQALGYDVNSIFMENPLLQNPGDARYEPTAGSPAVDAGRHLPSVTSDFYGRPRPVGGKTDIGPFEFMSAQGPNGESIFKNRTGFSLFRTVFNPLKEPLIIFYETDIETSVGLSVVDRNGSLVRRLLDDAPAYGKGLSVQWDGKNTSGKTVAAGFYILIMTVDGAPVETKKIVAVK
jgi:hypothetical protein